jgi:hypothetical protein
MNPGMHEQGARGWTGRGMNGLPDIETLCQRNAFLRWRADRMEFGRLAEKPGQAPPEALLQQVWRYQRLVQDRLHTAEGRPVRILHPGFWNQEAGPDFRKAIIQIGSDAPRSGDIEIDIVPSGWKQHSHEGNPAYRNVILHVTWEPSEGEKDRPSLSLKHALDSTVPELSFWLGMDPKPAPEGMAGKCSAPFASLDDQLRRDVVRQAAQARFYQKAAQLQARARQAGWEAALWEGLFAALGYKRNIWPMRRLAELMERLGDGIPHDEGGLLALQGRCLGVAGFLPAELRGTGAAGEYLRRVWDCWWRDWELLRECQFPTGFWNFAGIRPANHPQRRAALACHWILRGDIPEKLEHWIVRRIESPDFLESIAEILQVRHDSFWSYRWTLKSAAFREASPLLGEHRMTDATVNVILPWLYVRACAGGNETLAKATEARYFLWPAGEDNAVLRLARQRLFGGAPANFLKSAAEQQGILQIVRDFCDHSNSACDHCQFPELLRSMSRE